MAIRLPLKKRACDNRNVSHPIDDPTGSRGLGNWHPRGAADRLHAGGKRPGHVTALVVAHEDDLRGGTRNCLAMAANGSGSGLPTPRPQDIA